MGDGNDHIWFRKVHEGKWVPVNARGYAAMLVPICALLAITLIPPAVVQDHRFAIFWLFGCMVVGMPLCLWIIFALARRHS